VPQSGAIVIYLGTLAKSSSYAPGYSARSTAQWRNACVGALVVVEAIMAAPWPGPKL
jgi:hypothetical protein